MRTNKNASGEAGVTVASLQAETTNQIERVQCNTDTAILKSRSTSTEAQRAKLLALLRIAPQTTYSLRKHGIAQCAARIFELKLHGYPITKTTVSAVDSDGYLHVGVALYSLNQVQA